MLDIDVVVSGYATDADMMPAEIFKSGRSINLLNHEKISSLKLIIEEVDDRLLVHCQYEVYCGTKCLIVLSNDADSVARLLFFMGYFKQNGLEELYCLYWT